MGIANTGQSRLFTVSVLSYIYYWRVKTRNTFLFILNHTGQKNMYTFSTELPVTGDKRIDLRQLFNTKLKKKYDAISSISTFCLQLFESF